MADLTALGPAAVDDATLTALVGRALGAEVRALDDVTVEEVDYAVPAITTVARHWVRGCARLADGEERPFSVVCKQVQSWERHPFFAFVPEEVREMAAGGVPWRSEPAAYRSDLADHLPDGLTMPRAALVADLDELSAAVWLPEVQHRPAVWDDHRYVRAAHLMGRFAARTGVREVARTHGHDLTPWTYARGRVRFQVLPMLADDNLWRHPLVAGAFDDALRDDLRATGGRVDDLTAELVSAPVRASHGDACPGNLLVVDDGFCLVDFGFFGPMPVGFDLTQLLVGDVQLGRASGDGLAALDDLCVAAYVEGLRAEGDDIPVEVVRRAHALHLVLYAALSAVPVELLDQEPTEDLRETARGRAAIARHGLGLLERTAGDPLRR